MEIELPFICIFDEIDSTNDFLSTVALNFKEEELKPILVFSKSQTKGKGRGGRKFYSPKGGIYFSIILSNLKPETTLPLKVGLFFLKNLKNSFNLPVKIRWPNDFIIEDKKFGGILIEIKGNFTIIGVGINLEKDASFEVKDQATTYLNIYLRKKVSSFYKIIEKWISKGFIEFLKNPLNFQDWEDYSYFKRGDLILWEENENAFDGIYEGISQEGFLKVKREGKILNLLSVEKVRKAVKREGVKREKNREA